jgi:hypothetical protein
MFPLCFHPFAILRIAPPLKGDWPLKGIGP